MAAFPTVAYDWADLQEAPDSVVERSEMDRGRPKQRRTNSDVRVQVSMTLHFANAAEVASFETWFYTTINAGQDYFDWTHPRTGVVHQARVVNGMLGPLQYLQQVVTGAARRQLQIEYWRSAW